MKMKGLLSILIGTLCLPRFSDRIHRLVCCPLNRELDFSDARSVVLTEGVADVEVDFAAGAGGAPACFFHPAGEAVVDAFELLEAVVVDVAGDSHGWELVAAKAASDRDLVVEEDACFGFDVAGAVLGVVSDRDWGATESLGTELAVDLWLEAGDFREALDHVVAAVAGVRIDVGRL
jgi:hypothetical protein